MEPECDEATFEEWEDTIRRGRLVFYEVGAALRSIRDSKAYRMILGFDTFEAYCETRWGMSRPQAYFLISASEVRDNLSTIVDILPSSESQTRPLSTLPQDQQAEAWQQVIDQAPVNQDGSKRITAKLVKQVVDEFLDEPEPTAEEWTIQKALEALKDRVEWCAQRWPREHIEIMKHQLIDLADRVDALSQGI